MSKVCDSSANNLILEIDNKKNLKSLKLIFRSLFQELFQMFSEREKILFLRFYIFLFTISNMMLFMLLFIIKLSAQINIFLLKVVLPTLIGDVNKVLKSSYSQRLVSTIKRLSLIKCMESPWNNYNSPLDN